MCVLVSLLILVLICVLVSLLDTCASIRDAYQVHALAGRGQVVLSCAGVDYAVNSRNILMSVLLVLFITCIE